ncbi:MAG: hypothetical protein P8M79_12670 [Alphaproteobacteria bacterium]|nr:hypothetical protein [Alphaproteobacteria bacterium]
MSDKDGLMAFPQSRAMTDPAWRILGSMERLLSGHYASKEDTVKSVAAARRERFKHSLDALELRRQTNIETIATHTHTHDLVRLQY